MKVQIRMAFAVCLFLGGRGNGWGSITLDRRAGTTLTPIELNIGDTLRFTLKNSQVRTLRLDKTSAQIIEIPATEGLVYSFTCDVTIDGHPLTLRRYVGTQESFYEPTDVNGMRIWPDMALCVFDKIPERYPYTGNRRGRPWKDARFVVQEMDAPICPQPLHHWYPETGPRIFIGDCYHGGDCWMGAFALGQCHVGLDICMKRGCQLWAPIDFDDQWLFNSLAAGDNNNRWRGVRTWPDHSVWALQTHHLIRLTIPEHQPLKVGTCYAETAGVACGWYDHTHFEFKVGSLSPEGRPPDFDSGHKLGLEEGRGVRGDCAGQPEVYQLDPWILFHEIFETEKTAKGLLTVHPLPFSPAKTGERITFGVREKNSCRFYWSFGDGAYQEGSEVRHAYMKPGIYAVTVTADNGISLARAVQHLTVDGERVTRPALLVAPLDDLAFLDWPAGVMPAYGETVERIPGVWRLPTDMYQPSLRRRYRAKLLNGGSGILPKVEIQRITYRAPVDSDLQRSEVGRAASLTMRWLSASLQGPPGAQELDVSIDSRGLPYGRYRATVVLSIPGAWDETLAVPILLDNHPRPLESKSMTMDDGKPGCFCTPAFWVGHRLKGRGRDYRTNGARPEKGQFVRFTPELQAGNWKISVPLATPFVPGSSYWVRVVSAEGEKRVHFSPSDTTDIGTFRFNAGEGFVDILAEDSVGMIYINQIKFHAEPDKTF